MNKPMPRLIRCLIHHTLCLDRVGCTACAAELKSGQPPGTLGALRAERTELPPLASDHDCGEGDFVDILAVSAYLAGVGDGSQLRKLRTEGQYEEER